MNLRWGEVRIGVLRRLLTAVTLVVACAAAAVHSPGHISMDTSVQLYEAFTGTSLSWNPPFMSALLRWLGGGEIATTGVVLLQVLLLYGAPLLVVDSLLRARQAGGEQAVGLWRAILVLAVVLNPLVAIYAGIVWKDVLFGALLTAGTALALAAIPGQRTPRRLYAILAVLVFAAALLTRQQGVFMVPVLLLVLIASEGRRTSAWKILALLAGFAAAVVVIHQRVEHTVRESGARSTSVGFRSIMIFDMMGILARSTLPATAQAVPITPQQLEAVRHVYEPSRIDYIARDPLAEAWVAGFEPAALRQAWWSLVRQQPGAWLAHRGAAFATLLGLRGIAETQPVHIGVDGNTAYLQAVGLHERRGPRDLLVYRFASAMFGWPLYRHAFWLAALAGCTVAWRRMALPPSQHRAAGCIIAACLLFYASFVPTMISSDFRYLFGAIPLIGLLVLVLALGTSPTEKLV